MINPEIYHDKPCIRGLRYPVEMSFEEILVDYEDLEWVDILAVLEFVA